MSLVWEPQDLDIVDLLAIKAHHKFWVDDFVKLAVVSHTVIVLLIFLLIDS